jgi:hypothetical protein
MRRSVLGFVVLSLICAMMPLELGRAAHSAATLANALASPAFLGHFTGLEFAR